MKHTHTPTKVYAHRVMLLDKLSKFICRSSGHAGQPCHALPGYLQLQWRQLQARWAV